MADWLSVVSQLKSLVQVTFGDEEGARRTQENFSRQCPIVSQVRSAVEAIAGDEEAARETQMEFVQTVSGVADALPVVGHIKGGIHYACGDKDGGDNAMKSASRTTGALAGGAGGFLVGGPALAVAGGIAGAATMDTVTTAVDSAVHEEYRPTGYFQQLPDVVSDPTDAGKWFDTGFMVVGDGATGYAGGKASKHMQKFGNQRAIRNKFEAERQPLVNGVGKHAANDLVKAADRMKDTRQKYDVPQNKPHITTIVRDLESNNLYEGHNKQIRNYCRRPVVEPDIMSDYTNADTPTYLERRVPDAEPPLRRPAKTCAEHRAYHKFYKEYPESDPGNTRAATVRYDKRSGTIRAVERCDNCKAYGEGMGEIPGDIVNDEFVPNHPGIGKYSYYKEAGKGLVYAGGFALVKGRREYNSESDSDSENL